MSSKDIPTVSGTIVEEEMVLSLGDLCRVCAVRREFIVELVDEGALEPAREPVTGANAPAPVSPASPDQWFFSGVSLKRTRTALRLHRDLGVNAAGAAVILDLLDEIERIRAHLNEQD
jgi:chaperone modulatory protein CbpM